jgi:hypothetical protein
LGIKGIQHQHIKHLHDSFVVLEELIKTRRHTWDRPSYMMEFERLATEFAPKVRKALRTPDLLTREKMMRNPKNKERLFHGA